MKTIRRFNSVYKSGTVHRKKNRMAIPDPFFYTVLIQQLYGIRLLPSNNFWSVSVIPNFPVSSVSVEYGICPGKTTAELPLFFPLPVQSAAKYAEPDAKPDSLPEQEPQAEKTDTFREGHGAVSEKRPEEALGFSGI